MVVAFLWCYTGIYKFMPCIRSKNKLQKTVVFREIPEDLRTLSGGREKEKKQNKSPGKTGRVGKSGLSIRIEKRNEFICFYKKKSLF